MSLDFLLQSQEADLLGQYQDLFREHGIRCAVTRTRSAMASALQEDRSMTLGFSDERWSVFDLLAPPVP